jgi:hypothetical protein
MKAMNYGNTCVANHKRVIRGLFATWRYNRWWRKHDNCEPTE